ncbi:helix-turn-helix domain-containing protein [Microbulbifer spongiae]|uniref:Helix-turn-helix domain-containing protein n=1 Tax=Microbulbifer spongiae TaxID=2944933 RepID=A0ABY9E6C4_9GAMM|nr:helix-turn-helix domain-containing protein [Microbulbifer sp. MI-G]WKD48563.1 helix-turn-helix domain-containing protein [Microbulbifer sp. MI-G]
MKFGVYLRSLREKTGWTQPEAAEKIEIEQSYLSKLETGKCFPSEDIFSKLSSVYHIDAQQMSETIDSNELEKLKEVSEVRKVVLAKHQSHKLAFRRWLITGLVFLMFGGALMGASTLSGTERQYHYRSQGVLLAGESLDAFSILNMSTSGSKDERRDFDKLKQEMTSRVDQLDNISSINRGRTYLEEVDGGKRLYKLYADPYVGVNTILQWFIIPAMMFLAGSLGCFFISYRWR